MSSSQNSIASVREKLNEAAKKASISIDRKRGTATIGSIVMTRNPTNLKVWKLELPDYVHEIVVEDTRALKKRLRSAITQAQVAFHAPEYST